MATRLGVTLLALALLSACTSPRVVRLDTGRGPPREYRPPSSDKPMKVDAEAFEESLARLVLEAPLPLRVPPQGGWVRASHTDNAADTRWQRLMIKSFGGPCGNGQSRALCISRLDDWSLGEWDKLGVALGLSLEPLKGSITETVEKTLAPQLFYAVIATGLITWAVLAANPEPIFTKGAAIISAVLLIYLGAEVFLELVDASQDLKRATDRATTWMDLEWAGHRFAHRIGPEVARIFVLAATVVVSHGMTGGTAWLASRLSALPNFTEVAAEGVLRTGLHLANVGQVSAVAAEGSTIIVSLPATAVAMTSQGRRDAASGAHSDSSRSWGSFSGLKSALGSAGPGKQWHHIVEQTPGNIERFGPQALHNTENVIPLEQTLHTRLSALYSSIRWNITGSRSLTVRKWLSNQPYEAQRKFGFLAIENVTKGLW
jgi:hypothetical protein